MDALYRELDERYCTPVPNGNQPREIAFVQHALAKYKLTTCYVLSAHEPFNEQVMPIEKALQRIVGSSSTTIICFLPIVAYFEEYSVDDRHLCIRDVREARITLSIFFKEINEQRRATHLPTKHQFTA